MLEELSFASKFLGPERTKKFVSKTYNMFSLRRAGFFLTDLLCIGRKTGHFIHQ